MMPLLSLCSLGGGRSAWREQVLGAVGANERCAITRRALHARYTPRVLMLGTGIGYRLSNLLRSPSLA